MLVIGENINASSKSVAEAIANRDREFLGGLAKAQDTAGADFIDVNAGIIQQEAETIDSDVPAFIEAALRKYQGGRVIVNSVSAEPERLASIGSLAAEHQAWVVALAMGEKGIPDTVEERLAACEVIMNHLLGLGMKPEQVLFDPLVLPIGVDSKQGVVTLRTIEQIKSCYPDAKTVMGLSNISYGLPKRKLINRAFLLMAAYAGLDAVILDPLDAKAMSLIKVADMLTGKDSLCRGYIGAYRKGTIAD